MGSYLWLAAPQQFPSPCCNIKSTPTGCVGDRKCDLYKLLISRTWATRATTVWMLEEF